MATTEKLLKSMQRQAADADKKAEVAYVRAEKTADEEASRRLAEQYGTGPKKVQGPKRLSRGWKCVECHFVNYDIRSVCGECLATNPFSVEQKIPNIRLPGASKDPFASVLDVAGRSYRCFSTTGAGGGGDAAAQRGGTSTTMADIPTYDEEGDDDEYDDGEEGIEKDLEGEASEFGIIQQDPVSRDYYMKLQIPSRYWKFLIGTKGAVLQETQRLTGATVNIPRLQAEGGDSSNRMEEVITIKALDPGAIRAAHLRINATVLASKDKVEYTHFISIPLGTLPSLSKTLTAKLDEMKSTCTDPDKKVEPSIFQDPPRLHLTLLMLRLHSSDELATAMTLFSQLQVELNKIFKPGDKLHLRSLNYMNDDPTEVHVVYLEIERNETKEKLLRLINTINDAFIESGLALEKDVAHNEKLHATIVNSKWRRSTNESSGPRESFDATDLFRLFGAVDLGEHPLDSVELSILGGGNQLYGYFPSECSLEFPKPRHAVS